MKKIFIGIFLAMLFVPSIFMGMFGNERSESASSNRQVPRLIRDGRPDINFLSKAGDYFSYNYAFRNELVTADSMLLYCITNSSPVSDVKTGSDGYLFYSSTLEDYTGNGSLSDEDLQDISRNIKTLQEDLEKRDIRFVYTIAPNKNSVHGEYMSGGTVLRYAGDESAKNIVRLNRYLKEDNVNYADLYDEFNSDSGKYPYHKKDSHWNNKTALVVTEMLFDALDFKYRAGHGKITERNDFEGDLYSMLFPSLKGNEKEVYYGFQNDFYYDEEVENNFEPVINTHGKKPEGPYEIAVSRDSFGNSLLPFIAVNTKRAYFSRQIPFDAYRVMDYTGKKKAVIYENVERHIEEWLDAAPVMPAFPEDDISEGIEKEKNTAASVNREDTENGYIKLHGIITDRDRGSETYIILRSTGKGSDGGGYAFKTYVTGEGSKGKKRNISYTVYIDPDEISSGKYSAGILYCSGGKKKLADIGTLNIEDSK